MNLLEPVLTGIKSTNFFEGRLLTAQDLRDQQQANEKQRWRLGRAIGAGVVEGLEVTLLNNGLVGSPPTLVPPKVRVDKGMAINGRGQTLELTTDYVEVELARELPAPDLSDQPFNDCQPPTTSNIPSGEGIYMLVMSPALGFEEYAPKSGLGLDGKAIGCGRRYTVEGVQFRLERIPLGSFDAITAPRNALRTLADTATSIEIAQAVSQLQNAVAHSALNTAAAAKQRGRIRSGEPVAFSTTNSLLDTNALSDCDIPLAILFWDLNGVRFLDMWSVRRLARWLVKPGDIALFPRYGLERLLQFLDHAREYMRADLNPSNFEIRDLFRYLPPVGFIQVTRPGTASGYSPDTFFADYTRGQPQMALAGRLSEMLESSIAFGAVDLDDDTFLQTYEITENDAAIDAGDAPSRYVVYATRNTNGPMTRDGVARTFEDAWEVYGGLIKRGAFLPAGTTNVVELVIVATTGTAARDSYNLRVNGFDVFASYDQNADGVLSPRQITDGINIQTASTGVDATLSGADLRLSATDGRDINIGQAFGGAAGGGITLGVGGLQTGNGVTYRDGTIATTTALLRMTGAVREVMDMANRQTAVALSNALNFDGALFALRDMHRVQREMTVLFQSTIPGVEDSQQLVAFGADIEQMLDVQIPSGATGLEPSIDASDLLGAVDAQNAINKYVGAFTGEGVAVGPIVLFFTGIHPDGTILVRGEPATPHEFRLFNDTDKRLTFRLNASISGAEGTWATPTFRESPTGTDIETVTLDTDTSRALFVMVAAPNDATLTQTPRIDVSATVGPPTDRSVGDALIGELEVGDSQGDPVEGRVRITGHRFFPGFNPANLPPSTSVALFVDVTYTDTNPRDFILELAVDSTTITEWSLLDENNDPIPSSGSGNQRAFALNVGAISPAPTPRTYEIRVMTPSATPGTAKTATLSFSVRTADDPPLNHNYDGTTVPMTVPG